MSDHRRHLALATAIGDLAWLIDRYPKALDVLADTSSAVAIRAGSTDRIGGRSGDVSNPTADAAMALVQQGVVGETTRKAMVRCVNDLGETAEHMRRSTTRALHDTDPGPAANWSLRQALTDATWCNTAPHTAVKAIHTWRQIGHDEDANELHHAIGHLEREAHWLRNRVGTVLVGATQAALQRPEVPEVKFCRNHQIHGWSVVAPTGLCEECATFRKRYKALPTLAILRAWDYGRRNLTTTMIAEAQAKRKRRRSA